MWYFFAQNPGFRAKKLEYIHNISTPRPKCFEKKSACHVRLNFTNAATIAGLQRARNAAFSPARLQGEDCCKNTKHTKKTLATPGRSEVVKRWLQPPLLPACLSRPTWTPDFALQGARQDCCKDTRAEKGSRPERSYKKMTSALAARSLGNTPQHVSRATTPHSNRRGARRQTRATTPHATGLPRARRGRREARGRRGARRQTRATCQIFASCLLIIAQHGTGAPALIHRP